MFCNTCGKQLAEGDKFCTQCGTPVPQERLCPNCQTKLADNAVFCGQCGTRVGNIPQNAAGKTNPSPGAAHIPTGPQPLKYHMISKYVGAPSAGIAKATGTLTVYPDRLEYTKQLGSALGNFGLAGMAVAADKEHKTNGKLEVYSFRDIQTAYVGKYMAVMPAVVLVFNNGQVLSFNGTFTSPAATNIVNTILNFKANA